MQIPDHYQKCDIKLLPDHYQKCDIKLLWLSWEKKMKYQ